MTNKRKLLIYCSFLLFYCHFSLLRLTLYLNNVIFNLKIIFQRGVIPMVIEEHTEKEMNIKCHIYLGILLWTSIPLWLISQLFYKKIESEFQFFILLFVMLLSISNQSILSTKLYISKKFFFNNITLRYYMFSFINLLFLMLCLYVITIIFLFS